MCIILNCWADASCLKGQLSHKSATIKTKQILNCWVGCFHSVSASFQWLTIRTWSIYGNYAVRCIETKTRGREVSQMLKLVLTCGNSLSNGTWYYKLEHSRYNRCNPLIHFWIKMEWIIHSILMLSALKFTYIYIFDTCHYRNSDKQVLMQVCFELYNLCNLMYTHISLCITNTTEAVY